MRKGLTVLSVERIAPPAKGQVEHSDKGFPGLSLRVSYAGGKSFWFRYRVGGRQRGLLLGTYPAIDLNEARELWRAARISVARGIDPAQKETVGRQDTFAEVVREWIKRDKANCKARTVRSLENVIALDLLPAWGSKRVDTITKRDVIELLDRILDRGAPSQARSVFTHLIGFFRWCHGREVVIVNPMTGLKRPGADSERDRVLTDAELVKVWNACGSDIPGAAVRLLALTGTRREEACQLKWSEIDGDTIRLAGERTKSGKPHSVALSAPARALLDAIPRVGEFVFSYDGKRPINNWSKDKARITQAAAIPPWRLHDLRRTIATGLQRLGVNLQVIEAVLGHTGGSRAGIIGVYQRHAFLDEARAALEVWGAHVIGLAEGSIPAREPAEVRQLRRG